MQYIQEVVNNGSKQVVINEYSDGKFYSRLYVNNGRTSTMVKSSHKTLEGAKKWAGKVLSK